MPVVNEIGRTDEANKRLSEAASAADPQASVNNHFACSAPDWERIYHEATLGGQIYQDRMAMALRWIEKLRLPETARLLEIGCGAGFATTALAMRGYRLHAVDSVPAMISLTNKRLAKTDTAERVRVVRADVRHLPMPNDSFDLAFALGVLPWLDDPIAAVSEMARVTRPGGHVLITVDNSLHIDEIFDPLKAPIFRPLRRYLASALRAAKLLAPSQLPKIHRHSRGQVDSILSEVGLDKSWCGMLGFGPITLFGRSVLPNSLGIKVHRLLQAAANRNWPILSLCGMQYVVMSRKRANLD
jgi:ubiquinone/menaquinone biosynthesis C-methylase UbiE